MANLTVSVGTLLILMGLGGYFGGVLFDVSGNYHLSFGAAAISGIINISILTLLTLRLRRAATIGAPA